MRPVPKAAPAPLLGAGNHVRTQRIALDIATDGVEVIVLLNWKRLEAALIHGARADGAMGQVPAAGVRVGEPAKVVGEVAILARPDYQVPMVGHNREGEQPHLRPLPCLLQHLLECGVVVGVFEDGAAAHRSIEHVIHESCGG